MKLWFLLVVFVVLSLVVVEQTVPIRVNALSGYVDLALTTNNRNYDIVAEHPPGYYYLSTWTGSGILADPFIPAISKLTDKWSSIDLREDCTSRNGFCLTFSPDLVTDVSVSQITDSLVGDIEDVKWQSVKTVLKANDIKAKKLPDFIKELLKDKIKPGQDGKERIYLGGLIWGEPQPEYGHETIADTFNRTNASSLGTSSEGTWSWTDRDGSFGIYSNQATQDVGSGDLSMSQAVSDLGSANMYAQATTQNDGDVLGIACRKENNATLTYYCAAYVTSNQQKAYKVVAGSITALNSTQTVTYGAGRIIKLQTDGSTITTWYNGTQEHNFTDSSISAGQYAGLFAYDNWVLLDNFEASALVVSAPAITATPASRDFGIMAINSDYWSFNTTLGYSPSFALGNSECYFTANNTGTATGSITAKATNWIGTSNLTLTDAAPADNTHIMVSLYASGDGESDNTTLSTSYRSFYASLAAGSGIKFDVKVDTPTGYYASHNRTCTITLLIAP